MTLRWRSPLAVFLHDLMMIPTGVVSRLLVAVQPGLGFLTTCCLRRRSFYRCWSSPRASSSGTSACIAAYGDLPRFPTWFGLSKPWPSVFPSRRSPCFSSTGWKESRVPFSPLRPAPVVSARWAKNAVSMVARTSRAGRETRPGCRGGSGRRDVGKGVAQNTWIWLQAGGLRRR